jgi:hypothetical protein
MIIDLSTPRLVLKDKINEIIFEAKMRGYKINKYQAAAALTVALSFSSNNQALALQSGMNVEEVANQDIYAVIFSLLEVIKQYSYGDIKNMRSCFNSNFFKSMFK